MTLSVQGPAPTAISAGRYRIENKLGEGGMGVVYQVYDQRAQRPLALKCLNQEAAAHALTVELFEREFHVLKSLAHPNIVTAHEYGVDGPLGTPYYTMELLSGKSSNQCSPLPWREVCRLLRDVASALALIHSRRLVHRDVTTRNVYCGDDGTIKLIDFGSLCPMGVLAKECVGTPAFMAPETVQQLRLDQRTDLYSLGATAYQLLTGRHAYPSRRVSELQSAWRSQPATPSSLVSDIPPALDALVLNMLELNPSARPVNAAILIEKLTAIADLPPLASDAAAQAFLISPRLIGRDRELTDFGRSLARARKAHGGCLWIEAPHSMGRSRLLDAFALQAQVSGALVLRLDERDGATGHGLIDALNQRLQYDAADGGNDSPPPGDVAAASPDDPQERALVRLRQVTRLRVVVLLLDDVHKYGSAAIGLLTRIARGAQRQRLVLVLSSALPLPENVVIAVQWLRGNAQCSELRPLAQGETHELLASCFDRAPNLQAVASWCHSVSAGRPGVCVALAQHLVDEGIAVYRAGAWALPETLERLSLPETAEHLVHERLRRLDDDQLLWGQLLSLIPAAVSVSTIEAVALLAPFLRGERAHAALERLLSAQLVVTQGAVTRVEHGNVRVAFASTLSAERARSLHRALAALFQRRADETSLCAAAYHLQQAGADEEAVRVTIRFASLLLLDMSESEMSQITIPFGQWGDTFERALDYAEQASWPKRELYLVYLAILTTAALSEPRWLARGAPLFASLKQDTGYVYFDEQELDALARGEPAPKWKLPSRMLRAAVHHWSAPQRSRGLQPIAALRVLGFYATTALGVANVTQTFHTAGPPLARALLPFRALAPGIDAVYELITGAIDAGRGLASGWQRLEVVMDRLQAGVKGMPEGSRKTALCILRYLHALERLAPDGDARALEVADWLEQSGGYDTHAWQLRKLYQLYIGDALAAERCRERIELLAAQSPRDNLSVIAGSKDVAQVHALSGDVPRLRASLASIEATARRFPHWRGQLLVYRGEYARLVGDFTQARAFLEEALAFAPAGENYSWAKAVPPYIEVLLREDEVDAAVRFADNALAQSLSVQIAPVYLRQIEASVALAWAAAGQHARAAQHLDALLRAAEERGVRGVSRAVLYEARARVALLAGDAPAFERAREPVSRVFESDDHPALHARYRALIEQAKQRGLTRLPDARQRARHAAEAAKLRAELDRALPELRLGRALELLMAHCEADEGHLYVMRDEAFALAASVGQPQGTFALTEFLRTLHTHYARPEETLTATHFANEPTRVAPERWTSHAGLVFDAVALYRGRADGEGQPFAVALLHPKDGDVLTRPAPAFLQALCDALSFDD